MDNAWQFERETAVTASGDGEWVTDVTPDWNIGTNPNGGYVLASSLRAMTDLVGADHVPLSVSTHYLRPALGGEPASIEVQQVKAGRRVSVLRSTMSQAAADDPAAKKPRLTCVASFGPVAEEPNGDGANGDADSQPVIEELRPVEIPAPDACLDRTELPQGVDIPMMSRLDIRLDPATSTAGSDSSAPAAMRGWIRFGDGRPPDVLALPLFADAFPPSLFSRLGRIGWVPTVELTVHVRARPAPGWIQASFATSDLKHGLLVEDGALWDSGGQLVARSRQLAMLL